MKEDNEYQALDSIAEWSKWTTGLSIFSSAGCITALLTRDKSPVNMPNPNIINIKLAIIFFMCTIVAAWFIQFLISVIKQRLPDPSQKPVSALSHKVYGIPLRWFIYIEMILFILSLFFLCYWIIKLKA